MINEFIFGHSEFTFDFISPQAQPGQIFFQGGDGGGTVANNLGAGDAPVLVQNLSYAIGNLRTIRTRQFVDNLTYVQSAHTFKTGFNMRYVQHADIRGSVGGANANTTVNFNPTINTVGTAAFNIPADLNVQFDRPEFERSINFLLGRVGRDHARFRLQRRQAMWRSAPREGAIRRDGVLFPGHVEDPPQSDGGSGASLGTAQRAERGERPDRASESDAGLWRACHAPRRNGSQGRSIRRTGTTSDRRSASLGIRRATGKTSIRTNYRIAYDRLPTFGLSTIFQTLPGITLGVSDDTFGQNGGRLANLPKINPPSVSPCSLAQPAAYGTPTFTVVDPNLEDATTHMWSFGIQQEILPRTVFSVDYIGRRAYNLYGAYNANQPEIFRNGFLDAFKTAQAGGESTLLDQLTRPDSRQTGGRIGRGIPAAAVPLRDGTEFRRRRGAEPGAAHPEGCGRQRCAIFRRSRDFALLLLSVPAVRAVARDRFERLLARITGWKSRC